MGKRVYKADGTWTVSDKRPNSEGTWSKAPGGGWILKRVYEGVRVSASGRTKGIAKKRMDEKIRRLDAGLPARDSRATLGTWMSQWSAVGLKTRVYRGKKIKPTTISTYVTLMETHITGRAEDPEHPQRPAIKPDPLSMMPLGRIRKSDIERWILRLRDKGLSESSIRSIYNVLRVSLDAAVGDQLIGTNHAAAVDRPIADSGEAAVLSPAEVTRLLNAAKEFRYYEALRLIALTGLRRGEALALLWEEDMDLVEAEIHVRRTLTRIDGTLQRGDPKTESSKRTIQIPPGMVTMLAELKNGQDEERKHAGDKWTETGFVFTTEFGNPVDPRNLYRSFDKAAKRAKITGASPHTLRHSVATALVEGRPIMDVQDVLGHADISTTGRYLHSSPEGKRAAIAHMEELIGS